MNPRYRQVAFNAGLALLILGVAWIFTDIFLIHTGLLNGASATTYVLDVIRSGQLRSSPAVEWDCWRNITSFVAGCDVWSGGFSSGMPLYHVSINSWGFRGREYTTEKAGDTLKIFVLGDSFAFGQGVDNGRAFPDVLEGLLNADYGSDFEVFNLGHGGFSTDDEYRKLIEFLPYNPDAVILQAGANDWYECGILEDIIAERLESLNLSKSAFNEVALQMQSSIGPEEGCSCVRLYFNRILNLTEDAAIPLVLYGALQGPYNTPCLDGSSERRYYSVQAVPSGERYQISSTDVHLNNEGHRAIAEQILPVLVQALNDTYPSRFNPAAMKSS